MTLKEPTGTEQAQLTLPQLQPLGLQLSVPLAHPIPGVYCIEWGSSSINRLVGGFFQTNINISHLEHPVPRIPRGFVPSVVWPPQTLPPVPCPTLFIFVYYGIQPAPEARSLPRAALAQLPTSRRSGLRGPCGFLPFRSRPSVPERAARSPAVS